MNHTQRLGRRALRYSELQQQLDKAREELLAEVVAADQAGMERPEIWRAIDQVWSREYIRKVCDAAKGAA